VAGDRVGAFQEESRTRREVFGNAPPRFLDVLDVVGCDADDLRRLDRWEDVDRVRVVLLATELDDVVVRPLATSY